MGGFFDLTGKSIRILAWFPWISCNRRLFTVNCLLQLVIRKDER
ncbi:hypothetical protein GYMC10_2868 [Paenibacillus sp. Y412MC10]|nr:hypothetical protein GYMC10_2868 [Paenibacillus sp. Y412MC10]